MDNRTERIERAREFVNTVQNMSEGQNYVWVRFVKSIEGLPHSERVARMVEYVSKHGNQVGTRHVEIVEVQNKGTEFYKKGKTP
jgi:hypothetical protein